MKREVKGFCQDTEHGEKHKTMNKQKEEGPRASQRQKTPQGEEVPNAANITVRSTKKSIVQSAMWISGILWILSWIGIALEIFYWHHMTPSLRLNPPPQVPGMPPGHPGEFLLTVIGSSVMAPVVFLTLVLVTWVRRKSTESFN